MISKIDFISDFGIYKNFDWNSISSIDLFKDKNIFYGWNYSGKTTLSRIFSSLRDKTLFEDFATGDFKITMENNLSFTKNNLETFPFDVLVFNSDYVKENLRLDYDGDIKAIFFEVGEDAKISAKIENLEKLILGIEGSNEIIGKKNKYKKAIEEYEAFEKWQFTTEAKKIKDEHFISLINFTKADIKKIKNYIISDIDNQIIKDKKTLAQISKIIKIDKPKSEIDKVVFNDNYLELKNNTDSILTETPSKSDIIENLDKNPHAYIWALTGLNIHREQRKCFFCDNDISDERIEKLKLFFENQSSSLKRKCKDITQLLKDRIENLDSTNFPNSYNDFNEGFQDEYLEIKKEIDTNVSNYKKHLNLLVNKIKNKSERNIYTKSTLLKNFDINTVLNLIERLNLLIENNNKFSANFNVIIASERDKYKNHLVASFLKSSKYILKEEKAQKAYLAVDELDKKVSLYQTEINILTSSRESDSAGCAELESFIQSFLGKDDIQIRLNENTKQFNLIRGTELARNLSEGEKMAISFSHFLVSIKSAQKKNQFKDIIVFIDDPISSLDGNHIFQINSLLKETFFEQIQDPNNSNQKMWGLKCKQLFVSTHNFDFFNLLKEMPKSKGLGKKESRYFISSEVINAKIEKLPDIYNNYQSEYHYLFSEIMSFHRATNKTTYPKLLLMPNILRRFLEMYTLTQYPVNEELDQRADVIFGKRISKRICKPFHYFSHFNNIDRITRQSEFIADIGKACGELITFFETNNDKHYQALKQAINSI